MIKFPRVAIIAVHFGKLPDYFSLWLNSCAKNPDFDWLVFTDAEFSVYRPPDNVHFRRLTIGEFGARMSAVTGLKTNITHPYKVCDFRPIFWALLNGETVRYDFWGHCDLDMIFGTLRNFIDRSWFDIFDKIFSVGHFTLYRNGDPANSMYRQPHPELDWRSILTTPEHFGFDEHIGVNRIWKLHGGRVYENESLIADIDPFLEGFERVSPRKNYSAQVFFFEDGRIFRGYYLGPTWKLDEFMYLHFQKRKFDFVAISPRVVRFYVTPRGFVEKTEDVPSLLRVRSLNPIRLFASRSEFAYRMRRFIKRYVVRAQRLREIGN